MSLLTITYKVHSAGFALILSSWIHAGKAENEKDDREIMLAWHKK